MPGVDDLWIHIIGWLGGIIVVIAYLLNTTGKLSAKDFWYQFLNLIGSIALIINTYLVGAYPSAAVNVIWVIIAVGGLIKSKKSHTS